jgi:hypothetical protein
MSKFWQEESSSEEEQVSEESSFEQQPTRPTNERKFAASFIDDSDSGSYKTKLI